MPLAAQVVPGAQGPVHAMGGGGGGGGGGHFGVLIAQLHSAMASQVQVA
jgi:hypothetical protein